MKALIAALVVMSVSTASPAATIADIYSPAQLGITNALLTSSPNFTINVKFYNAMTVYVTHTYAAASAIKMSCKAGPGALILLAPVAVAQVDAAGNITNTDGLFAYASGGATRQYRFIVAPLNDQSLKCTLTGTGATTDTISVYAQGGRI